VSENKPRKEKHDTNMSTTLKHKKTDLRPGHTLLRGTMHSKAKENNPTLSRDVVPPKSLPLCDCMIARGICVALNFLGAKIHTANFGQIKKKW